MATHGRLIAMSAAWLTGAACADPAIEMTLALPDPAATQGLNLSCVGAVAVTVIGHDRGDQTRPPDASSDCVDLPGAPQSLADVERAIHGQFSFRIPDSGLAGVQLTGFKGNCNDHIDSHESVFYGGAAHADGADTLTVPLVPNITCNAARSYRAHVVDLSALIATGACAAPTEASTVFAADLHPRLLGSGAPRMLLERGVSKLPANAGRATVQSYEAAIDDRSCIALGHQGAMTGGVGCVNPTAPTLCSDSDEIEIASLPLIMTASSRDATLASQFGEPVFGAVWEPSIVNKQAVAGATVELSDPSQGTVVYVELVQGVLRPIAGAHATGASGLFIAYLRGEATSLMIQAPGHAKQVLRVASSPDWPTTVLAVLPRQ